MYVAQIVALLFLVANCLAAPLDLPNPSFEQDINNDGLPDEWKASGSTDTGKTELDATQAKDGSRSVKLTGTSPETRMWIEAARVPVKPGGMYLFECWMKSEGVKSGRPVVGVARYSADGSWDNWSYVITAPVNEDWKLYRQVFPVPDTTSSVVVRLWIERFEGTAWFDDIKVSEYVTAAPGFTDDMKDAGQWEARDGRLESADAGLTLTGVTPEGEAPLFAVAGMRRALPSQAADHPILKVQVGSVKGLWALKVRDRGYIQQARSTGGTLLYDLREPEPSRGGPARYIEVQALGENAEVTVQKVELLGEIPPAVGEAGKYSDHYVAAAGELKSLKLDQEHPYVAISKPELDAARARGEMYAKWLAGTLSQGDRLLGDECPVPDQGFTYSMLYNCPEHGVPLNWRADYPREHQCPMGNHTVTGPVFDREWRIKDITNAHARCRSTLKALGWAYAASGEEKYADKSRGILLDYADKFPNYLWHSGRGELTAEGNGMRVAYEPLGEAGWLDDIAQAYDLVASSPSFIPEERLAVEQMLRDDVRVSLNYDERLSNRQCHHNIAVAAVGLCLRDETLVKRAVGSLRNQLKYAVLGDGFWWECSPGYHYYAVNTMLELVKILKRSGVDMTKEPKLKLSYDGPLHFLFPDGTLPAVNDSAVGMRPPWDRYSYLHSVYEDPMYAPLLRDVDRTRSLDYLISGKELPAEGSLPDTSHLFFKAGMAMLKPSPAETATAVAFDWGQTVAGHGHADKLHITVHGNGELLGLDNGSRSYFSPVWRFWDRQTLSHNTVVVNERSQLHRKGRLELYDHRPGLAVSQATADEVFPGLRQRRTVFVTPEYVVDVFRVAKDSTDLALRAEPVSAIPGWRKEPWGDGSPASLARDFSRLERSTEAHSGKYAAMIANTTDAGAGWSTNENEITGPNTMYRSAVTPVEPGADYRLSAWCKTQRATGASTVRLQWMAGDARVVGTVTLDAPNGTEDWRELASEVTAPGNASHVGVQLFSQENSGSIWFDDISLVPVTGQKTNALTQNCDFETVDTDVQTIDWTYHNLGELTCGAADSPADFTMGRNVPEPEIDGENGYQYMKDLRAGAPSDKEWSASWVTDAGANSGLQLSMVGEPGTQVIAANGQGPGVSTVPLVIARRRAPDTVFGTVLQPFSNRPQVKSIRRLDCEAAGRTVPDIEGYGVAVELADRIDYYVVSYTPEEKRFGPIVLTPGEGNYNCLAAVSISGNQLNTMYMLGGQHLRWGQWSVAGPAPFHGNVMYAEEDPPRLKTDAELPNGDALRGLPVILDAPCNASVSVETVETERSGSLISLAGRPNLWLRTGMQFTVPTPVFLSRRAGGVFRAAAPAGCKLAVPDGSRIRTVEYENANGEIAQIDARHEAGALSFALTAQMLGDGRTFLVFDRPANMTITDRTPPRIARVLIDGAEHPAQGNVKLPFPAREVSVDFQDARSKVLAECAELRINGTPAQFNRDFEVRTVRVRKAARVTVTARADPGIEQLYMVMADDTLLRNGAVFTLQSVKALEVVDMPQASGGKAVRTLSPEAFLVTRQTLEAGNYEANLIASGPSLAANSMWLDVDDKRIEDVFHFPVDTLGDCSREVDITPALPRFAIDRGGRHVLRFSLREGPGPILDKLQILRDGSTVGEVECEDMLPR